MRYLLHPWTHSLILVLMVIVVLISVGIFFLEMRRLWRRVRPSSRPLARSFYPQPDSLEETLEEQERRRSLTSAKAKFRWRS